MELDDIGPIVGLLEISKMLGVKPRTSHAWKQRKLLPEPDFTSINGSNAWLRSTIEDWARLTCRMPLDPNASIVPRKGGRPTRSI